MRRLAVWYIKIVALMSILMVSFLGTYIGINHDRLFPRQDQVVIYGRDSCRVTSALRQYLDERTVPYIYANIDKPLMKLEFEAQLNLSEERAVPLPVVLVGGRTLESPDQEAVLSLWQQAKDARS
jgi:glutaredoxin